MMVLEECDGFGELKTICIYVSVKGRQKRATLGAVFGTPSTTPNPPL
jgi:hypothetical protein